MASWITLIFTGRWYTVWNIPAAFPFSGRGETRPRAIPVGQHSWKGQLDESETRKVKNFPSSSVQLSSLARTGWCCQSCWATHCWDSFYPQSLPCSAGKCISFGCLHLAELQRADSSLSQDEAATAPFFLPLCVLEEIWHMTTTALWTRTGVLYVTVRGPGWSMWI